MPTHPCRSSRSSSSSPPRRRRASRTTRLVVVPDVEAVPPFLLDAYLNEAPLFAKPPPGPDTTPTSVIELVNARAAVQMATRWGAETRATASDAELEAEVERVDRELELEFEESERANRRLWGDARSPLGVAPNAPILPAA